MAVSLLRSFAINMLNLAQRLEVIRWLNTTTANTNLARATSEREASSMIDATLQTV
jgi:hypothetical protein